MINLSFLELKRISIRHKVIFGFGVGILGFVSIGAFSIWQQSKIQHEMDYILHEIEPVVTSSLEISDSVRQAYSALGFYLLSPSPEYDQLFSEGLKDVREHIVELQATSNTLQSEKINNLLESISEDVDKLESYKDYAYNIAEDREANLPGLKYGNKLIMPLNHKIIDLLGESWRKYPTRSIGLDKNFHGIQEQIKYVWYDILITVQNYLANRNEASIDNVHRLLGESRKLLNKYRGEAFSDSVDKQKIQKLFSLQSKFETYFESLSELHSGDKWRRDTYLIQTQIGPLVNKISTNLDILKKHGNELVEDADQAIRKSVLNSRYIIGMILLVGSILGMIMAIILVLSICGRMTIMGNAMASIAKEGNLKQKLDNSGRDEIAWIAWEFNKFIKQIGTVVELVNESSTELASDASRTSEVTTQVSNRVKRQQQEIDEVVVAISDMSNALDTISSNTTAAADAAKVAMEDAGKGLEISGQSISSINGLANEVENISETVQRLASETKSIETILSVIKDISDQTNLLALNAAIEAARAGEYGRGFAVVADEVRSLSVRTAQETTNIQTMVNSLRSESQHAVSALDKGLDMAKESVTISQSAGEILTAISQEINKITETSTTIADSVIAQSNNSSLLTENINSISLIAEETVNEVMAASRASMEVSLNAGQMRGMIEQSLMQEKATVPSSTTSVSGQKNESDVGVSDKDIDDVLF